MKYENPPYLYHGDCIENWKEPGHKQLYLASDPTIAMTYTRDHQRNGNTPILIRFSLPEILNHCKELKFKIESDFGIGLITGPIDQIKHLGEVKYI